MFYRNWGKRLLDVVAAIVLLLLLSPVFLLLALWVRLNLGAPILFRQQRPGFQGKLFSILKFRTMLDLQDESGNLLLDEQRLTSFGRWLRSTSLDELPELLNVLKGEMSLVGPRPLLAQYLPLYSPEQARRHQVRPGITGWAQVNGRNAISWSEKFSLDVWYVDHLSFVLDMKIIFLSIWAVLSRKNIEPAGQAIMDEFRGNDP